MIYGRIRLALKAALVSVTLVLAFDAIAQSRVLKPGERWDFFSEVKPNERYILSFTARNEGPDSLENNAQLSEAFYDKRREMHGLRLPGWGITFTDRDLKGVPANLSSFHRVVLSSRDELQRDVFFAPNRAANVRIRFENSTRDATFYIKDVKLSPYIEKTVNINADFALGERSFSGFSPICGGSPRLRKTKAGNFLDVESYTFIDTTPVVAGRTYRLETQLEKKVPRNPNIKLFFLDENGRVVADSGGLVWITDADKPTVRDFQAPLKAVTIGAMINGAPGVSFKFIRLTEADR